jgi:pyruvate kinase
MNHKILVTLGPNSMKREFIESLNEDYVKLLRINMSHTPIDKVEENIRFVQKWTNIPVCLDSEGAQIRNQQLREGTIKLIRGNNIKIHNSEVKGDEENISFTPKNIARQFDVGDVINIDFNLVKLSIVEKHDDHCLAKIVNGGIIGSNKAVDINKTIFLEPITEKDKKAIEIGKNNGIKNYALSFASSAEDVKKMRHIIGFEANIISKIESLASLHNLDEIIKESNEILIDRGDLSRQVNIELIPFLQRRIIAIANSNDTPVNVATNLMESMVKNPVPTRAEVNDVISTLLMGADGLVLAAETAIGAYPLEVVEMVIKLIRQFNRWTPNSNIDDILNNNG